VPADFKGKHVWTLTYAGVTQIATASIDQNYSLDVGDPEPPTVKVSGDVTARVNAPVKLTALVGAAPTAGAQTPTSCRDVRAALRSLSGGASFAGRGRLPLETVRKPDRQARLREIVNNRSARFA
jgi:hypothetical protein